MDSIAGYQDAMVEENDVIHDDEEEISDPNT